VTEQQLAHHQLPPEEVFDRWERFHPIWIGARRELEPAGEWASLREKSIAALRDGELGAGVASPYLLAVLRRG